MLSTHYDYLALEMVASYGMKVGQSVFNTCFHIGRFSLVKPQIPYDLVFRQNVKMHLLGKVAVGDAQIRDVMVHRFLTQAEMERWGDYGKGRGLKPTRECFMDLTMTSIKHTLLG